MKNAKVTLISYTGHGHPDEMYAAALLAYTKQTRLNMSPAGFNRMLASDKKDIMAELDYMAGTIPSSWEFVDLTFTVENVSRACAQQITRTRTASYAMQSQRIMNMADASFYVPPSVKLKPRYIADMRAALARYNSAVENGESLEDARGLLPMNIHCNLVNKYNLRGFVDLLRGRASQRTQGEYRDIAGQMKAATLAVWPWAAAFFEPKQAKAIAMIEGVAGRCGTEERIALLKAADLLRKED